MAVPKKTGPMTLPKITGQPAIKQPAAKSPSAGQSGGKKPKC